MKNLKLSYDGMFFYLHVKGESLVKSENPERIMNHFDCLKNKMNLKHEVLI